jgi:membrane protease YdiL (CAAX protease family)
LVRIGKLKPIALWKAVCLFAATSGLIFLGLYVAIPRVIERGLTFLQAYLLFFYAPFMVILLIAIIAFRAESGSITWNGFIQRYRLNRIDKKTWIWIVLLTLLCIVAYVGLAFTGKLLSKVPLLAPPGYFPAEINPTKMMTPGIFMDTPLKGQWWIIPLYAVGWIFNIFGEELLWRGYLLPRQELSYGKQAWLVHGALWTLWHVFWKWNLLVIMPVAFAIPFAVQKTKNTWVGIIAHGALNLVPLVIIIKGVIG